MHLILLSGGSGKPLWPLSNDSRSKQFLKVLSAGQQSNKHISMVQRVWQQLQKADLAERTDYNKSQVDMIYSQLGSDVPLLIEPSRRQSIGLVQRAIAGLASCIFNFILW